MIKCTPITYLVYGMRCLCVVWRRLRSGAWVGTWGRIDDAFFFTRMSGGVCILFKGMFGRVYIYTPKIPGYSARFCRYIYTQEIPGYIPEYDRNQV